VACTLNPAAAAAAEPSFPLNLPAGLLGPAVAALAQQSGTSIGLPERNAAVRVPALRGRMRVDAALKRLLRKSGLRAVRAGPTAWRIEAAPNVPIVPILDTPPPQPALGDIVVSATKRPMAADSVPGAIEIVSGSALARIADMPATASVAAALNGLFTTNLGPGRDRLFIRGIADSPFDGFGQSSVAVQIGEARATYDAPDPDLRLVDMAQVELLKGPQGPLYGSGALGGVYRLTPAPPDASQVAGSVRAGLEATGAGGLAGNADAVVNLPLVEDRLAVRAVAYRVGQSGWINQGTEDDVNHGQITGGRLALRGNVGSWTIDALGLRQTNSIADSQYVEQAKSLKRAPRLPEPQDGELTLGMITASGKIGRLRATLIGSIAAQELDARYDASARAAMLGAIAPASFEDDRHYRVLTAEARIAGGFGPIDLLAGASFLDAHTRADGIISDVNGARNALVIFRDANEYALFGEATARLSSRLSAAVGVRLYRNTTADSRSERRSQSDAAHDNTHVSPSATLSWRAGGGWLVYGRLASALRPGGVAAPLPGETTGSPYSADKIESADLGVRWRSPGDRYSIDATAFGSRWTRVQADFLSAAGLITTRNAGNADNYGLDLTLGWRPLAFVALTGGVLRQRPRIDPTGIAVISSDRRLPVVPDIAAHGEMIVSGAALGWGLKASVAGRYIGHTRLSFDPGLDRENKSLAVLSTSLSAERGGWTLRAGIDNLGDTHADSFAFGNPFSVADTPQHAPVRPRTLTFSIRRTF